MDQLNFHGIVNRAQLTRSIAGEYMELLEEGQSVDDWIREVETRSPEAARALRKHFVDIDRSNHNRDSVDDALAEADGPLFPAVADGVIAGKGFATFQPRKGYPSVVEAFQRVQAWVLGSGRPMVTLAGSPGTGKTHLAQAAASARKNHGATVFYRSEAELIGELMSRMQSKTAEALLEAICQTPWLILDDMGVVASSAWKPERPLIV